ncbi:MAG: HYR domain-containing protein [Lewinellaceae bacterium]|nr:HYR domain-containing protein [Saprospiraceae bacterium]MCB9333794.1 HYR domain-containing protein [Lewinellaceae bacterium]
MRNKLLILFFLTTLFAPAAMLRGQAVILKVDSLTVPCHDVDTFLIPVRVFNFNDVAGLQFTFSWNAAHLDYAYITDINPALSGIGFDTTSFISQGDFTFSWTTIGGVTLPDTSILFKVAFARIGGPATLVEFTNNPTAIAAINPMGDDLMVETVPGQITPVDGEPPTIVCPADVSMGVFGPTPVNDIAPASVLDNCSVESIGWSSAGATVADFPNAPDASGAVFNIGQSTVTYLVTDIGGNTASCTFLIDLELMPGDSLTIIASDETASCGQTVTVDITALNFDSIAGLQFSMGWDPAVIAFASVGNFNPSLVLNNGNFGTTQTGSGFLGFAWTSALPSGTTLSDGSVLFSVTFNVVATGNASTNIVFGAVPTDLVAFTGKTTPPEEIGFLTINGSVTINDNQPPVIECPANVSVMAPTGSTNAQVNGLEPLSLSDNCGGTVMQTYVQMGSTTGSGTGPANGTYNAGSTTVVYTAEDAAGNTASCSFSVIVDAGTPLTLMLDTVGNDCQSANSQVAVNLSVLDFVNIIGVQFNVVWDTSILKFDSIGNQYPGLNLTPTMFFNFASTPAGTLQFFGGNAGGWPDIPDNETFFTIYFTAVSANKSNIDFSGTIDAVNTSFNSVPVVTINGCYLSIDLTPPDIVCPMDTLVTVVGNECNANVTIDTAQATDACSGIMSIDPDKTDDIYPAGTTVVTFTATDLAGNSATCSFSVTVQDNLPPQLFNCPADMTVDVGSSMACEAKVTWTPPDAFDQCTGITPNLVGSDTSGSVFPIGDTLVVYTAIDIFDDSTSCSFTVTVRDTASPTLICLDDFQVVAVDSCSAVVDFSAPIVSDNCDQNVVLVGNPASGSTFPPGATAVVFTATDASGNASTCSFTITVADLNPPVLDTCPVDMTVNAAIDSCGATATWIAPGATDDCTADVSITQNHDPGAFFPVGNTMVIYEAQDAGGNTATCSFTVTVVENVPPVINNCPPGFVFEMPSNKCDTLVNWTPPTSTDNCMLDTLIASNNPGTVFSTGVHTVTYTAIDASGNSAECAFIVAVNDNQPPVFTSCPDDITVVNASPCGEVVDWIYPTAVDNCLLDTITSTKQPSDVIFDNVTNVLVLAIDASGNRDTCAFTITLDVIVVPPTFDNFPPDITLNGCPQEVSWTVPVAGSGFCEPPIITAIPDTINPGDTFPVGVTQIIYLALDSSGVERLRDTFTVTIIEDVPPVFACPENVAVHVGGVALLDRDSFILNLVAQDDCDAVQVFFDIPSATDNCGDPVVEQTMGLNTGFLFKADSVHTLVFQATDAVGNTSECVVQVGVLGLQPLNPMVDPMVACPDDEVIVMVDSFPGATYTWTGPDQSYPNSSQIIVIASPANAGLYTVFADINGCVTPVDSAFVLLASKPDAVEDLVTVDPLVGIDSINVLANDIYSPPSDYSVLFDSLPAGVTYLGNGIFSFSGSEQAGRITFFYNLCSNSCPEFCDMAVVTIEVRNADCSVIPNIITPNGDGVNDYFTIPCLDTDFFNNNSIVIYNQWGDKVFDAAPYSNDPLTVWRGTLNGESGKDLPDGVYFYIFKAGPNEPAQKGFVEIFR